MDNSSIVRYCGINSSGRCGYCKSTNRVKATFGEGESSSDDEQFDGDDKKEGSVNFGLIGHLLSVDVFNKILDLGWSRSGQYLYKPVMERTCCPQYTIRLDIHKFKLSRSQKRVLNTMTLFLRDGRQPGGVDSSRDGQENKAHIQKRSNRQDIAMKSATATAGAAKSSGVSIGITKGADESETNARPFEKKKVLRRRRAEEKLTRKCIDLAKHRVERAANEEARRRPLESFLAAHDPQTWKHKLEVRLVSLRSEEFRSTFDESFNVYRKYQAFVHEDEEDEMTPEGYTRFLVSSPLFLPSGMNDSISPTFGSYHQQYWMDGKIIAVGVVDILPRCLSAKYFYYDPEYNFLSMGTYSALREIALTKELCSNRPELHYYYMGFYLYDCPKMRYKGKFRPSDLLCDNTHKWVPLTECTKLLEENGGKFTRFGNPFTGSSSEALNKEQVADIDTIRCLVGDTVATFSTLRNITHNQENLVEKARAYLKYAGSVADQMILCL